MRTISFLSDYGAKDEFVGVVKSVIRSIAPDVQITDITHGIPRHDIRAGSLALARASQYLNPGIVLAIVDPGVGSDRRGVAVELAIPSSTPTPSTGETANPSSPASSTPTPSSGETATSSSPASSTSTPGTSETANSEDTPSNSKGIHSVLIGPDNGLLAPAVALLGGAARAVSLTNADLHLPSAGATFAGRDIFAPAAAHLCAGVSFEELGEEISVASLMPAVVPSAQIQADQIVAEILWIDHFGNAQLNIGPDDISPLGERFALKILGLPEPDAMDPIFNLPGAPSPLSSPPHIYRKPSSASSIPTIPASEASSPAKSSRQADSASSAPADSPQIPFSRQTSPTRQVPSSRPVSRPLVASLAASYDQIPPRDAGLVIDSYGMISIAMRQHPAAEELNLEEGMSVIMTPLTGDLVELTPRLRDTL